TGVAHDHDGGGAVAPAFADIRAHGLLAHRRQPVFTHVVLDRLILLAGRQARAQPTRFASDRHGAGLAARLHAVLDRPRAVGFDHLGAGDHGNTFETAACVHDSTCPG